MESKQLLLEIQRKPVAIIPAKKVISTLPGEWPSPYEGKGYEPLGYRDFQLGDDPRRINLPASARRGVATMVERVALRDFKIMVVIDNSPSMHLRQKRQAQITAAALLLYSAWQAETTFGLGVVTSEGIRTFGMGIGSRHFYHLYRIAWNLLAEKPDQRTKGTRVSLGHCLPPNAMLLYCSDYLAPHGAVLELGWLWHAVKRYDFIPLVIQDELEYSFPSFSRSTFVSLVNTETAAREEVWISPKIAKTIRARHENRFRELFERLNDRGYKPLHIGAPDTASISTRIGKYFRARKSRYAA